MPDPKLDLRISRNLEDLKSVRVPGATKPLDQMTLGELIKMRPGAGGTDAESSYSVNAFTDNVSVSTSSLVEQVGQIAKERAMRAELEEARLNVLRDRIGTLGRLTRPGG